jgi:hypothetical protein
MRWANQATPGRHEPVRSLVAPLPCVRVRSDRCADSKVLRRAFLVFAQAVGGRDPSAARQCALHFSARVMLALAATRQCDFSPPPLFVPWCLTESGCRS